MLLDVNLLLYAYDPSSAQHERAQGWIEDILSRQEPVGLAWLTILAFLRISTNPRLQRAVPLTEAISAMAAWLSQPSVSIVHPGERHWSILSGLLPASQSRGPLVTDAHLAALAIEHGATLCTHDRGFARFRGLRVLYPLEA